MNRRQMLLGCLGVAAVPAVIVAKPEPIEFISPAVRAAMAADTYSGIICDMNPCIHQVGPLPNGRTRITRTGVVWFGCKTPRSVRRDYWKKRLAPFGGDAIRVSVCWEQKKGEHVGITHYKIVDEVTI